jgi:hypothetical protein
VERNSRRWQVLAQCAYSHTPTKWREIFAEAQLPYAKIMGCAHFGTVRAASR